MKFKNKRKIIYFGAAGAGLHYCKNSGNMPDFFVDNDKKKHGDSINGIEIKNPDSLLSENIKKIVITSGYVSQILPQLLDMGINNEVIEIPPKSSLGKHIFEKIENRIIAADKLYQIMQELDKNHKIIAVGGTALGFARDSDFIKWDIDIDLFAPENSKKEVFMLMEQLNYTPNYEGNSLNANLDLNNGVQIPISFDFFDSDSLTFVDKFEEYEWIWPTEMFTNCKKIKIHEKLLNIPNSIDRYLTGVYGKSWKTPKSDFSYKDYSKS